MKEKWQALMTRLEGSRLAPLVQFVKFGLVGVSNTLLSYAVEMLCFYVLLANVPWDANVRIAVISVLSFLAGTVNSYYWNNRFVFTSAERTGWKQHLIAFGKTLLCYAATGLVIAPALKMWLNGVGVPFWAASLGSLIVTIPLNFVLNKFWAFAAKR